MGFLCIECACLFLYSFHNRMIETFGEASKPLQLAGFSLEEAKEELARWGAGFWG